MIYFSNNKILIRRMQNTDPEILAEKEIEQGWNSSPKKFKMRLKDMIEEKCISFVAEYEGNIAGYINLYIDCECGAFGGMGYPEIVDFCVLEKYRQNGVGSKLMDIAEETALNYSDTVYLGVGLHSGYGSAQKMYVKRGYIPDGSGVWYGDKLCEPYAECVNDDDLNLYFAKKLK